jgi:predicted RNase H-like HicB family nuclease
MRLMVKVVRESADRVRAWCPSLPGCMVRATSEEEAKKSLEHAIRGYLASLNVAVPHHVEQHVVVG